MTTPSRLSLAGCQRILLGKKKQKSFMCIDLCQWRRNIVDELDAAAIPELKRRV